MISVYMQCGLDEAQDLHSMEPWTLDVGQLSTQHAVRSLDSAHGSQLACIAPVRIGFFVACTYGEV